MNEVLVDHTQWPRSLERRNKTTLPCYLIARRHVLAHIAKLMYDVLTTYIMSQYYKTAVSFN